MKSFKKPLAVLSIAAVAGLIATTVTTIVSAKPTAIVVEGKDSKVYEYNYEDLKTSAVAVATGDTNGAKLYNDFISRKSSIKAYYDDAQKSYVDFSVIASAATDAAINNESFDFKSFTETADTEALTTSKVSVDTSGNAATDTTSSGNPEDSLKTKPDALVNTGTATYLQSGNTVTQSNQNITASDTDQSAVKVTNSGTYKLSDSTITTSGNTSSMDNSSFYGLNAAVLAESGSKITVSNTTINTTGSGANAIFACGEGSTVNLSDVKINCTATGAHGVDATVAGVLNLNNVDIVTSGDGAAAAIATDRGGGTINVTGGVVTTNGTKSPGIYSTGVITVTDGTFTTNKSEAVTVEGKNSVKATNCTFTSKKNYGVFIYQSFSGDAEVGAGSFTMDGGSITANEGPMFYSTNTTAIINLKNATVNASSGILLKAGADEWGTTGSNGSNITLNADSENLAGDVELDNVSTADLVLKDSSVLKGTINSANTAKSVEVSLDSTSTWNVTGNSYITRLTNTDTTLANIDDNGYTIYYSSSDSKNSWLNGKSYTLKDGGKLTPISSTN